MPVPKPLGSSIAARSTLAARLSGKVDRLRQLNTRFGLRPNRVFLVWSEWSGVERGEGREAVITKVELLPTPQVSDLTALNRRPFAIGIFPEGSIRVDQISVAVFTRDMLNGLAIPIVDQRGCVCGCRPARPYAAEGVNQNGVERTTDPTVDFWWEVVEDGRGDDPPQHFRFRLLGEVERKAFGWAVNLEAADEELDRSGKPQIGPDTSEKGLEQFQTTLDDSGSL